MQDDTGKLPRAAAFLRQARQGTRPADLPADLIPATPAESYRLQDLVIGDEGIAGWKILATASDGAFTCAALPRPSLIGPADSLPLGDRLPEIEVEIAIRIARDLPPRAEPYTAEEVDAALGTAHAALEVIESRFLNRKAAHPLSALADVQSSRAFVIGSGTADWRGLDLPALPLLLTQDGSELARGQGGASVAQIIAALVWLANHAAARGTGLHAGQHVITGARIGPLVIPPGQRLEATVPQVATVSLALS